jgi:AAA domain
MRRHTSASPCAICGGHEALARGQGKRCAGFSSEDGAWVHCERAEHAGSLPLDERTTPATYLHRIGGPCNCGQEHAPATVTQNGRAHTPRHPARRIVATYEYIDAAGRVLYRVARFDPKGFLPQHMTEAGAWANGFASDERVLYRLPDVLANPGRGVFVVEGEKDADRLAAGGLIATTNPGGAASWRKHAADYAEPFRDHPQAIVIVDNDADGRRWAAEVASSVAGVGCPVRVLELADLPDGGDVSDWLEAGHTAEELKHLARDAARWEPPGELVSGPEMLSAGDPVAATESISLPWRTAAEIAATTPEEVAWVAAPWVAAGAITELAGPPKAAGKTTFAFRMGASVLDGADFLGQPTRRGAVVLLTEEADATLRPALSRAGLLGRADLHVLRRRDTPRLKWPEVCRAAFAKCREVGAVLLVVDTAAKWMQLKGEEENSSGAVMAAMEPLQAESAPELAVLLIRHERKSGGLVGEAGRGSNAWTGDVDVSLSLRRLEGNAASNGRRLEALSRFDETPSSLVVELTDAGYVAHGTVVAIKRHTAEAAIRDALPASEATAMTADDLSDATEVKRTTCAAVLTALTEGGEVVRTGDGVKGSPHRYHRPEMLSAAIERERRRKEMEAEQLAGSPEMLSAGAPSLKRRKETAETGELPADAPLSVGTAAVLTAFPHSRLIARHHRGGTVEWVKA